MSNPVMIHKLPERFAFDEDTSLKVFLRENFGKPVAVCAHNMRRVDSLLLQYLIAAANAWQAAGQEFFLTDVSSEVGDALTMLGIHNHILCWKVAA